jgi:hypothetical protein
MPVGFEISPDLIAKLMASPDQATSGVMSGQKFSARLAIPQYRERVLARYAPELKQYPLADLGARLNSPLDFRHFGLVLNFDQQIDIVLNDSRKHLDAGVRKLVDTFGPVILRNARLEETADTGEQRNIFPHMRFHYDRSPLQESQVSLFSRDPRDPEQRFPRQSSTLFVANVVAWLQSVREGLQTLDEEPTLRPSYDLFAEQNVRPLFGDVILEQPWNEPEGTGELCVINNRTVLHASFHGDLRGKGWRIGARYLI